MQDYDEVSDTDVPGPGASVADLSAIDSEATDDEFGTSNGNEISQCVGLHLNGQIGCLGCQATGRPLHILKESQFAEHVTKQHPNMNIT